jgi:hypothetical protein
MGVAAAYVGRELGLGTGVLFFWREKKRISAFSHPARARRAYMQLKKTHLSFHPAAARTTSRARWEFTEAIHVAVVVGGVQKKQMLSIVLVRFL